MPFGQADARPIRLVPNTPPGCTGMLSPGVNNYWPKWSPSATVADGKRPTTGSSFLPIATGFRRRRTERKYGSDIAALCHGRRRRRGRSAASYPAIYLWNQSQATLNITPAWRDFHIPIVID